MNQFKSVCDPEADERHIGITLDELSGGAVPTRVLCCGHSLGGALATLAGAWAAYEYPRADVRCITLGSPRVGNRTFCNAMKYLVGDVHRLVHGWDPVPTMPPPTGFTHVKGRMFLYKQKCRLVKRPWCVLPTARCVRHALPGRRMDCYTCCASHRAVFSACRPPRPRPDPLAWTGGSHAGIACLERLGRGLMCLLLPDVRVHSSCMLVLEANSRAVMHGFNAWGWHAGT